MYKIENFSEEIFPLTRASKVLRASGKLCWISLSTDLQEIQIIEDAGDSSNVQNISLIDIKKLDYGAHLVLPHYFLPWLSLQINWIFEGVPKRISFNFSNIYQLEQWYRGIYSMKRHKHIPSQQFDDAPLTKGQFLLRMFRMKYRYLAKLQGFSFFKYLVFRLSLKI